MQDDLAVNYSVRTWLACLRRHPPVMIRRSAICPVCEANCSRFKICLNNRFYQYRCPSCASAHIWPRVVEQLSDVTSGLFIGLFIINSTRPHYQRSIIVFMLVPVTILITQYLFSFFVQIQTKDTSEQPPYYGKLNTTFPSGRGTRSARNIDYEIRFNWYTDMPDVCIRMRNAARRFGQLE
jgi:hypothetical protein